LKNPELEYKIGELDNLTQVRQGIVLVGDTFTGKSTAINALKGLLNDKLTPQFDEFYTARSEEKIKSDEQARKSKDSESSVKMFRA